MSEQTVTPDQVRLATMGVRLDSAEHSLEKLVKLISETQRYTNVMVEDLIGRVQKIENAATRFEENLNHVNGNGNSTNASLSKIEERLQTLEKMAWVSIGGFLAITGISAFLGLQVLKMIVK